MFMEMHTSIKVIENIPEKGLKFGINFIENTTKSKNHNVETIKNSFPYFMYTRVFPFLKFHLETEAEYIYLVFNYFGTVVNYEIDFKKFLLTIPPTKSDLESTLDNIKTMSKVLTYIQNENTFITEVCLN